jgi:hypothetical protein
MTSPANDSERPILLCARQYADLVSLYRLYRADKGGHIHVAPVIVSCEDDDDAITEARQQYVDGLAIQVWDRPRR